MPAATNKGPALISLVHKKVLDLGEIGYDGGNVVIRINPKAGDYDKLSANDKDQEWQGVGAIVLDWNLSDEDGNAVPLPKNGLNRDDVPHDIITFIMRKFYEFFNERYAVAANIPKDQKNNSNTSSTSSESPEKPEGE